jgi:hypothetical protein
MMHPPPPEEERPRPVEDQAGPFTFWEQLELFSQPMEAMIARRLRAGDCVRYEWDGSLYIGPP